MKKFLIIILLPFATLSYGQELSFTPDVDFLKMPDGWYLQEVAGIAVNSADHIFVFHRGAHPLLEFDDEGNFIRSIAEDLFVTPHAIRIDKYDNLWSVDMGSHVILKFDSSLNLKMVFGKWNYAGIELTLFNLYAHLFNMPTDIAFDNSDNIYITDGYGNSRVMKFDKSGEFIKSWGTKGESQGQFDIPHTIQIVNDLIYIGDRQNQRIQIFNTEGELIEIWENIGFPYGLVDYNGNFYMTDGTKGTVSQLSMEGQVLGMFGEIGKGVGQFDTPHMIDVDSKGNLYVAEVHNWRVQKLTPKR